MKNNWISALLIILLVSLVAGGSIIIQKDTQKNGMTVTDLNHIPKQMDYWFLLNRKSKKEYLYRGVPGDISQSTVIKEFNVNVGIMGERPTPLPKLMGKEYWNLIAKFETTNDPETAPYFLTLDIPAPDTYPYGPMPYEECNGQCDWVRAGPFGLHGIANTPSKLTDKGSSGCIRHTDEEITYLYNLLNPSNENPIRYYINDI